MSDYDSKKVDYGFMVIGAYAREHGLSRKESFNQLVECGGIQALDEFYDIEHTLPLAQTIDDLTSLYARTASS